MNNSPVFISLFDAEDLSSLPKIPCNVIAVFIYQNFTTWDSQETSHIETGMQFKSFVFEVHRHDCVHYYAVNWYSQ